MSENKDLNALGEETLSQTDEAVEEAAVSAEETVSEVEKTEEVVPDVPETTETPSAENDLDKELEEIRDYFQQELDKATAEAQEEQEETEDGAEDKNDGEDNENLCLCCGEKEKMEGSDYCEDCYEAMRRYPFKWVYFLAAILMVYVAVLAIGKIGEINAGWVYAYEGDVLAQAGWYSEASEKYQMAQNYLYRSKVEPKIVYLHSLETSFEQGGFNVINSFPTSVATLFEEWELNLPHMKNLKKDYMKAQEMLATVQTVNDEIFSEYGETAADDLPYDEIIKKISALENRALHIGTDEDGNEVADEPTTEYNGTMSTSNAVYFKRNTKYDTAMIQYFKYYFASVCKRPGEEKIGYLESVKANAPEMTWLYASELGMEYAENGDREKALECADKIYEHSETDVVSYYIRALVAKKIDKDYDAAIEFCNKGNGYSENYEFYRQIALNYLLKGDYEKAQENAQTAYDTNEDLTTINTLAFCAVANKDNDKFDEMQKLFDEYNEQLEEGADKYEFMQSVRDLKSGKKTVEQILEKGGYDLYD